MRGVVRRTNEHAHCGGVGIAVRLLRQVRLRGGPVPAAAVAISSGAAQSWGLPCGRGLRRADMQLVVLPAGAVL